MIVRSASPDDLQGVLDLFREATQWLASKRIDQWQWDPRVEQVRSDIEQGNVFVGEDEDGRIIATITVDTYADPDFWGANDDPRSALYIHRMIVAATTQEEASATSHEVGRAVCRRPRLRLRAPRLLPLQHRAARVLQGARLDPRPYRRRTMAPFRRALPASHPEADRLSRLD